MKIMHIVCNSISYIVFWGHTDVCMIGYLEEPTHQHSPYKIHEIFTKAAEINQINGRLYPSKSRTAGETNL